MSEQPTGDDYYAGIDHSGPHWCKHDGGPALVQPPEWTVLFYVGAAASTPTLETRDCPYAASQKADASESSGS